jgi:hypothetical protein
MSELQAASSVLRVGGFARAGDLDTWIGRFSKGLRVDYPLSMVAAMDNATHDSGGSRHGLALWAGFSLVRGN